MMKNNNEDSTKQLNTSIKVKWTLLIVSIVMICYALIASALFLNYRNSLQAREFENNKSVSKTITNVIHANWAKNSRNLVDKQQYSYVIYDTNNKVVYKSDHKKIRDNNTRNYIQYKSSTVKSLGKKYYVIVKNHLNHYNQSLDDYKMIISQMGVLIFALAVLLSYLIIRKNLQFLNSINQTITEVSNNPESNSRIHVPSDRDELTDLSEKLNKMLDRLQSYANQQKSFVQDVSHELRTPVAAIKGHLELIDRWGKDDPEVLDESIKSSLHEVDRLKNLIQEMLDLTKAENVSVDYKNESTDVQLLFNQMYDEFSMLYPDYVINFDNDIRKGSYAKIYRGHLERIVVILMDNAVKYSGKRREINLSVSTNNGNLLEVAVQDFGEGIDKENVDKIFNRFYREDKARSRASGGNGLGLSIAKSLVQSYGGSINVESVKGSGSVFRFEIPLWKTEKKKD